MNRPLAPFGGERVGGSDDLPDFIVACNNGFRAWELRHHKDMVEPEDPADHELSSLVVKYDWAPGLNRAECLISQDVRLRRRGKGIPDCRYPTKACPCGFYAYYDVDSWSDHPMRTARFQRIHGVIEGFGRCVVGSKGFRAELALISGLLIPSEDEISEHWRGSRSTTQARDAVVDILRVKFPTVPLYDRLNDLLMNTPLLGKPRVAYDLEDPEGRAS